MKQFFSDRRRILIVFGLFFSVVLSLAAVPGGLELRVTLIRENKIVLALPISPGERFTIQYYHSVEMTPIWEEHSVDKNGTIFIEEERYVKLGAGMGRMPGVGRMTHRGPYEAIENMHMPVGNFILRVGSPGVDHTIIWRDNRINLSNKFSHEALQFSASPVTGAYRIYRALFPNSITF